MDLNKAQHIHCIGVGGIGLSGLARLLFWQGKKITGSDIASGEPTIRLEKLGVKVTIGPPDSVNLPAEAELVVYSLAIQPDHPEILAAQQKGISVISYPEALGQLTAGRKLITISGTHGKTTTASLIGHLLVKAGFDPTVIVGSIIHEYEGNARLGRGEYFVIEADEYGRAFLNYRPGIAILTNIERDHLDVYRDLNDIENAFVNFLRGVNPDGLVIANSDDPIIKRIIQDVSVPVITYGLDSGEYRGQIIALGDRVIFLEPHVGQVELNIPGRHNVLNALSVIACGLRLGIKRQTIIKAFDSFRGVWRRFERVGQYQNCPVISDYAHHPTEIKATLQAARDAFPDRRILAVFQPHQRHRTKMLFQEFSHAFNLADKIIITEIYEVAGRDEPVTDEIESVSSKDLAYEIERLKIDRVWLAKDFEAIKKQIDKILTPDDLILIMGAGTIDELARDLVKPK